METGRPKDWVADETKVSLLTDHIMLAIQAYLEEHKADEYQVNDVFMAAHNVHKRVVQRTALLLAAGGTNPNSVLNAADRTFRKAMRDLRV